ncbi:MAG: C39 family peptidase [Lachnospiraceae bacterium]|nr:C39 family peptidase [Lachnospiraceae bacterium]
MATASSLEEHAQEQNDENVDVHVTSIEELICAGVNVANWENRPLKELPPQASIELELVYQHPELPTGCESVALTMLLKYYGFDLDKTTIASEYLIYSSNFVEGFIGSPFTQGGAGIYSPGLTRTANKYLNAQESELNAINVTDSTPEELYRYVSEDTPVVIWNTVYNLPNNPTGNVVKWGEKEYVWDRCEHCMVLSGYDLERNVVIIHDPIEGVVERDADVFWERYEKLGSMALIIR